MKNEKAVIPRRLKQIVSTCRLLSEDSDPDGWPAIQMKDITALCDGIDNQENLIVALDEYIAMLGAELDEVVGLAFAHGWRSTRHEQGKEMREKIQQLREGR